jgi:hypothetical protein
VDQIKHLLQVDPNAMWGNFSLNHFLTSAGLVVSPKLPGEKGQHLDGGFTVQTYGSSSAGGIDAIQRDGSIHTQRHRKATSSSPDFG